MAILIIFTIILFYIGQFIERLPSRFIAYVFNSLLFVGLLYCFLDLTYTADWGMYYLFFKREETSTDPVFYWLTLIFKKGLNLQYTELYQFHIFLIISLYYFFISRFTRNIFFIFLAYLILDNVHLANQIRYYMGFPILMSGFYFLFYKKKYILSIICIILSIICHSGLSFLLVCIPVYYFVPAKKFYTYILSFSLLVFLVTFYIYNSTLGEILSHYGGYFNAGSSFLGGLFNAIPYILFTGFLYFETFFLLKKNPEIVEDPQFRFLNKIAFFPIIFIPASFLIQVIGHRYVMPFSFIWMLYYYIFFIKNQNPKVKLGRFIILCGIVFISAMFIYIIPGYLFPENHFMEEFLEMIKSSDNLKGMID